MTSFLRWCTVLACSPADQWSEVLGIVTDSLIDSMYPPSVPLNLEALQSSPQIRPAFSCHQCRAPRLPSNERRRTTRTHYVLSTYRTDQDHGRRLEVKLPRQDRRPATCALGVEGVGEKDSFPSYSRMSHSNSCKIME